MFKFVFFLFGLFWLGCRQTTHTAKKKLVSIETEKENEATILENRLELNTSEKKDVVVSKNLNEVEEPYNSKKDSLSNKPSEPVEFTAKKIEPLKIDINKANHSPWNALLIKYVNTKGDVDYKGFQNDNSTLEEYLNNLAKNSPEKSWSKNEKLAYYINLYNAATVKLILDNYPIKSIKNIKNPWGKNWIKIGDELVSLGNIEHKILRKMGEPRIHFAINCASFSCPKLLNKAFTANQMEVQLQQTTFDFINDITRNIISKKKMQLSNIFKWYKKDFTENGSLTDYIKPYTSAQIGEHTDIDYLEYDWNLNEVK